MSNMSYCRFRNTVSDLQDCLDNLEESLQSTDEVKARTRLIKIAYQIVESFLDEDGNLDGEVVMEVEQANLQELNREVA